MVDVREVNIKQTKRSFLLCHGISSGHSTSSDTEVNTDPLINLDRDEGAAINRERACSK